MGGTAERCPGFARGLACTHDHRRPARRADELQKVEAATTHSRPGAYEKSEAVLESLVANVRFDRPDDIVALQQAELDAMTLADVNAAARRLRPEALTWLVVGDRKVIETRLRRLDLGTFQVIDAEGGGRGPKPPAR